MRVPSPIVMRLNTEMKAVLALPDVREKLSNVGVETTGSTPERFSDYLRTEIDKWAPIVKASGAKPD